MALNINQSIHFDFFLQAMWKMLQVETAEDFVISMGESHSVREFVEKAFKVVDIDIV